MIGTGVCIGGQGKQVSMAVRGDGGVRQATPMRESVTVTVAECPPRQSVLLQSRRKN